MCVPGPTDTVKPGERVAVGLSFSLGEGVESTGDVTYEVVTREGQVLDSGSGPLTKEGDSATMELTIQVPEGFQGRWLGIQLRTYADANGLVDLTGYPPLGITVWQGGSVYPAGALGNILGVNQHYTQGMSHEYLRLLTELGVKWARDNVSWAIIEQTPGNYVFPAAFEERLRFYEKNNLALSFTLFGPNAEAYPDDPYDEEAYGRFCAAVARKLREEYDLEFILILWNEPNNFGFRRDFGGQWYGAPPSPWVEKYVRMANAGAKAIHQYDPSILTFTNSDVISNHYWFMEQGLAPEIKGFAIHPYGAKAGYPEVQHYDNNVPWVRPFTVMDADQSTRSLFLRLKEAYTAALGHPPVMVITEYGRLIEGVWKEEEAPFPQVREEVVAAELPRFYIAMHSIGVESLQWFTLADWRHERGHGLVYADGRRRQTFTAFKTLSLELGEYSFLRQVAGKETPTKGLQAYLFKGSAGYKLALWNTEGPIPVTIMRDHTGPVRVVSHLGEELSVAVEDQVIGLEVGPAPVYISGVGAGVVLSVG